MRPMSLKVGVLFRNAGDVGPGFLPISGCLGRNSSAIPKAVPSAMIRAAYLSYNLLFLGRSISDLFEYGLHVKTFGSVSND